MMNINSIGLLAKLGYKFIIKDDFCDIIMNDTIIMYGQLKHDIYCHAPNSGHNTAMLSRDEAHDNTKPIHHNHLKSVK